MSQRVAAVELSEDELDVLVSLAIRRAEVLDDIASGAAGEAWREVMEYEKRLALLTAAGEIAGGVARVGAVSAALAAGERVQARALSARYLAEESLPPERRAAIERVHAEDRQRLATRYPALDRHDRLGELDRLRETLSRHPSIFPLAA